MPPSILKAREVSQAQTGPRALKDPRSRQYAIQTIYALKTYLKSRELDEKRVSEELEEIERFRHWEILGYPSKDALLEAETGLTQAAIEKKILQVKSQAAAAPAMADPHKRPGNRNALKEKNAVDNVNRDLVKGGNQQSYLARRLKRDAPAIFAKLETYPSIRAAALEAGIIKRQVQLRPTPEAFAKFILKHFSEDEINELLERIDGADLEAGRRVDGTEKKSIRGGKSQHPPVQ